MIKVSILMNGYNCEKYVADAIDSVFFQKYKNWEIVFVDNCSIDNTASIVHSYKSERIKYISTSEHISLGAARAVGLESCDGDYICFLDTDDLWLKEKLSSQLDLFSKNKNLKMVYTGVTFIDADSKEIGRYIPKAKKGDVFRRQLVRYEINQQSVMIKNDFSFSFDRTKKYSVDYCLFMSICSKYEVEFLKDIYVKYRMHDSNLSHSANELEWIEQKDALDKVFEETPSLKDIYVDEYKQAYARVYYYKARYLMKIDKRRQACQELKGYANINLFYFGLYVLSFFPSSFWNYIHRKIRKFS